MIWTFATQLISAIRCRVGEYLRVMNRRDLDSSFLIVTRMQKRQVWGSRGGQFTSSSRGELAQVLVRLIEDPTSR